MMCQVGGKISAGILCYMVDRLRTHIVLGREQYVKGWSGSMRWSEFGGQSKTNEQGDPVATASREFFEETLGVLGDQEANLRADLYNFRVVIKRNSKRHYCTTKVLYVMQVPMDDTLAFRFFGRREHLKHILFSVARIRDVQRRLAQQRLPVPDYLCRVRDRVMLIHSILSIEQCTDDSYWIRVRACYTAGEQYFCCPRVSSNNVKPKKTNNCSLNTDSSDTEDEDDTRLPQIDAKHAIFEDIDIPVPVSTADDYAKLITLKNWLDRLVASFPRDVGARAVTHRMHGSVPAWLPYVRREFLEKDDIRPWSMDELQACVAQYACAPTSVLRGSFIVPLKLVLQQLSLAEDGSWRYMFPLPPRGLDFTMPCQ